ncbi:hypothetical protein BH09SUM1_BH09SUM1_19770 [soil metagenome]
MALTPLQRKAVETLAAKVQYYLDIRYQQVRRINPKVETVWEDVAWQQMTSLRISLSSDKLFGPTRMNVAELLLSDDIRRRSDLFMRKSQNCLIGEIIEEKEKDSHKTSGAMEIHDMRTLCYAMDPSLETIAILVQTFIWWDLEDACDWGRYEKKAAMIAAFEENGITPEMAEYYKELALMDHKPTAEEAILFDCKMMKTAIESFRLRRNSERGYMMVVRREQAQAENPEMLIDALASQQNLIRSLSGGGALDPNMAQQFARAMNVDAAQLTAGQVTPFLENMIAANKKRLRAALNGTGSGAPVIVKREQLDNMDAKYAEITKNRKVEEPVLVS